MFEKKIIKKLLFVGLSPQWHEVEHSSSRIYIAQISVGTAFPRSTWVFPPISITSPVLKLSLSLGKFYRLRHISVIRLKKGDRTDNCS